MGFVGFCSSTKFLKGVMQTFLPYEDFEQSARCLDRQRLGKQRVEAYQILRTLMGCTDGWKNHPAVKMWRGHEYQLWLYMLSMCREWIGRGYQDTLMDRIFLSPDSFPDTRPSWLGDPSFHASHRSNLLRKNAQWYGQFGWVETPDLPYRWPTT